MTNNSTPSASSPARWLKTFWHAFVGSLTDLNYYVEVLNAPFKFSLKFAAVFYLLLGIILTLIFAVKDLPVFSKMIDGTRDELVERYPADLVFSWKDQQLSSSPYQKIQVPFPAVMNPVDSAPKYMAEFDTSTDQAPQNVSAVMFINKQNLYVNSFQGSWNESPIVETIGTDPQEINRDSILKLAENSRETQADFLIALSWLTLPFFSIGMFLLRLLMIAFNTIIIQFLFQVTNKPLTYRKVFQLSLHALVPVELIHQISALLNPNLEFPMFNLSYWIIMTLLLWHMRHLKVLQFEVKKGSHGKSKK